MLGDEALVGRPRSPLVTSNGYLGKKRAQNELEDEETGGHIRKAKRLRTSK
jgi:hypothetical protein